MQQVDAIQMQKHIDGLEAKETELTARLSHLLAMEQETMKEIANIRSEQERIQERLEARRVEKL